MAFGQMQEDPVQHEQQQKEGHAAADSKGRSFGRP